MPKFCSFFLKYFIYKYISFGCSHWGLPQWIISFFLLFSVSSYVTLTTRMPALTASIYLVGDHLAWQLHLQHPFPLAWHVNLHRCLSDIPYVCIPEMSILSHSRLPHFFPERQTVAIFQIFSYLIVSILNTRDLFYIPNISHTPNTLYCQLYPSSVLFSVFSTKFRLNFSWHFQLDISLHYLWPGTPKDIKRRAAVCMQMLERYKGTRQPIKKTSVTLSLIQDADRKT